MEKAFCLIKKGPSVLQMRCFVRFGNICTIQTSSKTPVEEAFNFTNSNTFPWVFFTIFKLFKGYQIP